MLLHLYITLLEKSMAAENQGSSLGLRFFFQFMKLTQFHGTQDDQQRKNTQKTTECNSWMFQTPLNDTQPQVVLHKGSCISFLGNKSGCLSTKWAGIIANGTTQCWFCPYRTFALLRWRFITMSQNRQERSSCQFTILLGEEVWDSRSTLSAILPVPLMILRAGAFPQAHIIQSDFPESSFSFLTFENNLEKEHIF